MRGPWNWSWPTKSDDGSPTFDVDMIRKLKSGKFRIYSRHTGENGKRKNLGTFDSKEAAQKHEREIQYFKKR